ncbi:hypothetical protein SGLAU_01785 [Streptomyces glaucescens]|uniref:Uncharacterized protein n=1 Tax=Streptomyces glaucescens TaxID=1907 RepID=A0A089YRX6_STRGA|nr:hypothetical protein [Streptomyces glaucescens]AIR96385.1 hypothetical protein SGLAU_01785 [Streptomyces glaucescens]
MTTYGLGPTKLYDPSERLLHGKGVESAAGAGGAEDWVRLDRGVHWATHDTVFGAGTRCWRRVGFRSVDTREIADWRRAPYWQEGPGGTGAPSWSLPPTESEIALCLCHGDPRVRAAALALDESADLPASVLPLVLIRSADTDDRVRTLARAVLGRVLAGADEALPRRLASLAVLLGKRWRYGAWAWEAVLGRLGGLPEEVLARLLADNDRESRLAGLAAAAEYGLPAMERVWAVAEQDRDEGVRAVGVRTAIRLALASGQQTVLDGARARFLAHLDDDRAYGLRLTTFTTAVEAGFLPVGDLAALAAAHRYRKIRRHACAAVLAHPDGDVVLDRLLAARDTFVRSAAVSRLRRAGRGGELPRYLTALLRASARDGLPGAAGGGVRHPRAPPRTVRRPGHRRPGGGPRPRRAGACRGRGPAAPPPAAPACRGPRPRPVRAAHARRPARRRARAVRRRPGPRRARQRPRRAPRNAPPPAEPARQPARGRAGAGGTPPGTEPEPAAGRLPLLPVSAVCAEAATTGGAPG